MTNEEFERKAEFLLNQQARFDVGMQELREAHAKTEKVVSQTAEMISSLATVTFEGFKITDAKIRELNESQKLTSEQIRELRESQKLTSEQIRELRESQKLTDEQIRKVNARFDRPPTKGESDN